MDTRADDSDSGSSRGSWVFVDENNPTDVNAPNQFYLNCLGEPVQELTENDLGVVNCDSDSDGISVISETEESLKESSSDDLTQDFFTSGGICDENEEVVENIGDEEVANAINDNGINLKKLFITSSLIGAGVVVVAILIAPYITPQADSEVVIDDVSVQMPRKYISSTREINSHFHCQKEHKKRFSIARYEKAHNESKKNGKNWFNTRKGEDRRYSNHIRSSAFKTSDIKHANSVEREGEEEIVLVRQGNKKSKKRNKQDYCCGEDITSKEKRLKAKEEYLAKKEEYLIMKEYELLRKKIKLEKKLDKCSKKSDDKSKKRSKKYYKVEYNGNRENRSDGEWYVNFHRHRENIRKREHMADWLFDRAYDRNKRRDEARWYFQWMIGRQEGRFKRPLRR